MQQYVLFRTNAIMFCYTVPTYGIVLVEKYQV